MIRFKFRVVVRGNLVNLRLVFDLYVIEGFI